MTSVREFQEHVNTVHVLRTIPTEELVSRREDLEAKSVEVRREIEVINAALRRREQGFYLPKPWSTGGLMIAALRERGEAMSSSELVAAAGYKSGSPTILRRLYYKGLLLRVVHDRYELAI